MTRSRQTGGLRIQPHPLLKAGDVRLGPAASDGAKALTILPPPPIADAMPAGMAPLPLAPAVAVVEAAPEPPKAGVTQTMSNSTKAAQVAGNNNRVTIG